MPKLLHLLIKPSSGNCNLRCHYCFYHDVMENRIQGSYGFMSDKTQEMVLQKALSYAEKECTIAYQGGEPTLIGLDYFRRSIELQNMYNTKKLIIHNAIQTNGYHLNEEWAKFFAEHHFLVGLSLDGISETHNEFRLTPQGKGTFHEIMKTAQLFDKYGVEYNILTVVNARTARRIQKIYNFYQNHNFRYLQFIPCLDPLGEESGAKNYSLTPEQYGDFLKTLFDLWYQDLKKGISVSIRQFDNYIQMLLGYPPESCGMSGICGFQNVIEADGSVYPCDFYVLDRYCLGNLNTNSFEEIDAKRYELHFIEESRPQDEKCQTCRFFSLCRGGCKRYREPYDALTGTYHLNYFCPSYCDFFEYAGERLIEIAKWVRHTL